MSSNNDTIADALNITPLPTSSDANLPIVKSKSDNQVEDDCEYVRDNLYDILEIGRNGIQDMSDIARQSQHPRAYEVLSTMIKQLTESNKELIDLHEKKKKIQGDSAKGPNTVNNNLFVGSTAKLLEIMNSDEDEDGR